MIAGSGKSQRILASTRNTDEAAAWLTLLSQLTDDELAQYGKIAEDQLRLEWQLRWLQMLCAIGASITLGLAIREFLDGAGARVIGMWVLATVALAYWPLQKARMRRMWRAHGRAVAAEQARRPAAAADRTGSEATG